MRLPVNQPYTVTTPFGVPDSYALFGRHSGIDYAGFSAGRPIYAPASGRLTNVVSNTGGNMVVIFDGKYYHRLMHNNSFERDNGDVSEGDMVARAGTTGLSTGVHCHWDVNTQGIYPTSFQSFVDPSKVIEENQVPEDYKLNKGDVVNYFNDILLHPPTQADIDNWVGKTHKEFLYQKVAKEGLVRPGDAERRLEQVKEIIG